MERLPILTLAELKDFLGIRDNITTLDARLSLLIETATKQIEDATGRHYTYQGFTDYFTSRDNTTLDYNLFSDPGYSTIGESGLIQRRKPQILRLKGYGLDRAENISVWYDPYDHQFGDSRLLVRDRDYRVDQDEDQIIVTAATVYAVDAIKVSYFAGIEPTGDPLTLSENANSMLKMAALVQSQFLNVKLRNDNVGMGTERTVSAKDRVTSTPFLAVSGLTPEAASLVREHKRIVTGRQ